MESIVHELPEGAICELFPTFLERPRADAVLETLLVEVPWRAHVIRLFGREVPEPRLSAWLGEPHAVYAYSGVTNRPEPWTKTLAALREELFERLGLPFDSVLANLYRDGQDSMGFHSDDEPELGPEPVIASISLGATRRFQIRHKRGAKRGRLDLELGHGSLLVMRGAMQERYRHGVPKDPRVTEARVNLTFRRIVG